MTPEEAREHLAWPEDKDHPKVRDGSGRTWFEVQAGESHPYWNRLPDAPYEDAVMYAVARAALATIAGMHTEYAIEHQHTPGGQWHQVTGWSHEPPLNDGHTLAPDERIIRRYVTEPEEA